MEKTKSGNRRLIPIGGSVGITLPKRFLEAKGWKAGDKVGLVFDDIAVIVRPKFFELKGDLNNGNIRIDKGL